MTRSYVQVERPAELSGNSAELKYWARLIAGKYMGQEQAETYGARNSVEGELLVTITPTKMTGQKDVAG
jgi:hypothetical protein